MLSHTERGTGYLQGRAPKLYIVEHRDVVDDVLHKALPYLDKNIASLSLKQHRHLMIIISMNVSCQSLHFLDRRRLRSLGGGALGCAFSCRQSCFRRDLGDVSGVEDDAVDEDRLLGGREDEDFDGEDFESDDFEDFASDDFEDGFAGRERNGGKGAGGEAERFPPLTVVDSAPSIFLTLSSTRTSCRMSSLSLLA